VQGYVSQLRKLLEPEGGPFRLLVTEAAGYALRLDPEQLDLQRFERLLAQGKEALAAGNARQAASLLREVLALFRGPPLADFTYEPWAQSEIGRIEELRLTALEERIEAELAFGKHNELTAELETLVAEQPLRERLRGQLMLALYRAGRQAEALEAYQQARTALVEQLGIDPSPELQTLYKQILNQDEALTVEAPPATPPTNLPAPPNALVGRQRELAELIELVRSRAVRLVTLTGTGGIGKTRLAHRVARDVLDEFREGVFFVSLARISDPELVMPAIAQTVGIREEVGKPLVETLNEYMREKEMLLLLDNFEQVVDSAPAVATLVEAASKLKVLVTSRAPLRVSAERTYDVPPLGLPDPDQPPTIETVEESEAAELFIERATAAKSDFPLTENDLAAVTEICLRLDGLPLALELAAARTPVLTAQALLARLDERLGLLTTGARDADERHRTLRATIDWSHDLLSPPEQTLFARLSVFVGGCCLEAAQAVCASNGEPGVDILDGLASLVEKNLLRQRADTNGQPRYSMLETIREYALERLVGSGERDEAHDRHARH
jgi:predicted ATPase